MRIADKLLSLSIPPAAAGDPTIDPSPPALTWCPRGCRPALNGCGAVELFKMERPEGEAAGLPPFTRDKIPEEANDVADETRLRSGEETGLPPPVVRAELAATAAAAAADSAEIGTEVVRICSG